MPGIVSNGLKEAPLCTRNMCVRVGEEEICGHF